MPPPHRLRLPTPPSPAKSRGISMIEIMVALGLTSGLLMVDAERQRSNIVKTRQLQANEAIAEVLADLQTWLRVKGTIKASFQGKVALTTAGVPETQETINNANDSVLKKVEVLGVEKLKQAKIGNINFIGRPDGPDDVQALDGRNGWAYIKTMWIGNFNRHSEITEGSITTEKGTADLNVRTWVFTNRLQDSSLDCTANDNCIKQTHTLPLEIRVNSSDNTIVDGDYGVFCRSARDKASPSSKVILVGESPNCGAKEFFNITKANKHATYNTVISHEGQCCQLVQ